MKTITEKEYRDYLEFDNKLHKLIEEKTKQLSLIIYNKLPKGEYIDCEFTEKNGKLFVEFEYWLCGENCRDQFYLPLQFLFDETYPEKYRLLWNEEKRKINEEKELKKKKEEENRQRVLEEYERSEYERLKLKYEDD